MGPFMRQEPVQALRMLRGSPGALTARVIDTGPVVAVRKTEQVGGRGVLGRVQPFDRSISRRSLYSDQYHVTRLDQ